jgi:iron complex transport system substrate-binding protein
MSMKRCIALFLTVTLLLSVLGGCGTVETKERLGNGWEPERSMELQFATQFSVDYYQDGYKLISLADGTRFLVIPEGSELPKGIAKDIVPLYQPVENIYLAAAASMCLFDALDCMDVIRLSGTKKDGWHIENAQLAMQEGRILYAGKYSEPDYEMMLDHRCPLAIESLMIGHASEVKDKLEELGIAVFIDQSSMEPHPLGRTEWIKLYGALLNKEETAEALFEEQVKYLNEATGTEDSGKTVAFFHISSSGYVVARKSGDYVTKMLELAGGNYVFDNLGDPETRTSTVTIEMEKFFATAKDADYIIYNSTIGGEIKTIDELLAKNELLAEFKAVQNGNVWCTSENMYQETTQLGQMIQSFQKVFSGEADELDELPYLYRLQ